MRTKEIAVPLDLPGRLRKLGLNGEEILMVIVLNGFRGTPTYPSQSLLAQLLGRESSNVNRTLAGLAGKGLIQIQRSQSPYGTNKYDLSPLFETLALLEVPALPGKVVQGR